MQYTLLSMVRKILSLLILGLFFYSCGKIDLPDPPKKGEKNEPGKVDPLKPSQRSDTISVTEALTTGNDSTYYTIVGYIVGYANRGHKGFVLDLPSESMACILLADKKNNTDHLLPINIGSPNTESRKILDLYTHPENLGRKIMVGGYLEKYYGVHGIKKLRAFEFLENKDTISQQGKTSQLPTLETREQVLEGR